MAPEPVLSICTRGDSLEEGLGNTKDNEQGCDSRAVINRYDIHCPASWDWDQRDRSKEVFLHGDSSRTSVTFHPNWSNGTAGIRASQPLLGAYNYWELHIGDRVFGTSLMFGVSTKKARLHANEFTNLLGEDAYGWGLSHRGSLYHNGQSTFYCKPFQEYTPVTVGVLVDRFRGEVTYFKDGVSLGLAFTGLDQVEDALYPTICSTAAKTVMTVGHRRRSFLDLQDRCREVIAASIVLSGRHKGKEKEVIDTLPLPAKVKRFIYGGVKKGEGPSTTLTQWGDRI